MTAMEKIAAKRALGRSGLEVSAIGLGCMSLSGVYGASDDRNAVEVVHQALDNGITLLDTADMYGWGHNEELVGRAIAGRRANIVLASKFGQVKGDPAAQRRRRQPGPCGKACDASLKRLGVDTIDLYYQHRVDPRADRGDGRAMAELVKKGMATARRRPAGELLSGAEAGVRATIYRITEEAEEDAGLLSYLEARALTPGAHVTILARSESLDSLTLEGPRAGRPWASVRRRSSGSCRARRTRRCSTRCRLAPPARRRPARATGLGFLPLVIVLALDRLLYLYYTSYLSMTEGCTDDTCLDISARDRPSRPAYRNARGGSLPSLH